MRALPPKPAKVMVGACVGNFLEWFDFALFGLFATEISRTFFPPGDSATQLLEAFTAFAGGFLARPFGGLFFGYLGDRHGRVYALRLSVMIMGIPTAGIAILPGYATLGWLSTALLVLMVNSTFFGGEFEDFSREWFAVVGVTVFLTMVFEAVWPHLAQPTMGLLTRARRHYKVLRA